MKISSIIVATSVAMSPAPASAIAVQGPTIIITGTVADSVSGATIAGASVRLRQGEGQTAVVTGPDGRFRLTSGGAATIVVTRTGYATAQRHVDRSDSAFTIRLVPLGGQATRMQTAQSLERLTVTAVRASDMAPIASTTLDQARLQRDYSGQDIPLTLRQAPSVTAYSESGSLLNYSYFRVRGIDQSRVNITLDGIPLNEPEDQQI
jgi:iron complex outermembrane receptor protein